MARRREVPDPQKPERRDFTPAELVRIRERTATPLQTSRTFPHYPASTELDAIHAAAGRVRGFKLWELGGGVHDPERAYQEEVRGGLDPRVVPSDRGGWHDHKHG